LKSNCWILLGFLPLFAILYVNFIVEAFGQEEAGEYINRNAEIWGLFYRLMVAAFVVGAVVNGVIVYVIWRYRESHKKNRITEPLEGRRS
jgi:heme/copper-type cytochrome/quinol oxidase subunit 2